MQNFMGCTSLSIDNDDKVCITFKTRQPHITCFFRRFDHGFREIVDDESREGVSAVNVPSRHVFIISDDDYLSIHDHKTYKTMLKHDIELKESDTDDKMEILSIKLCPKQEYLAVLSGKNLIKEIEELHQLHVYKLEGTGSDISFKEVAC